MAENRENQRRSVIAVEGEIMPPMVIDCASWCPEVPANLTKIGFTVVAGEILNPLTSGRATDDPSSAPSLMVTCQVSSSRDPIANWVVLLKWLDDVNRFDRALGGAGLTLESNHRDNGSLKLIFSPVDPIGAAERIRQIVDAINGENVIIKPPEIESLHAASASS